MGAWVRIRPQQVAGLHTCIYHLYVHEHAATAAALGRLAWVNILAADAARSCRVVVKGGMDDEAVLCTKAKTFALKHVETSNVQLLIPPNSRDDSAAGAM